MHISVRGYNGKSKKEIDTKIIEFLYWDKVLSITKIAKKIDVSQGTIRKIMVKENIARRKSKRRDVKKPSKKILKTLYLKDGLTLEALAKKNNVAQSTVFRWMKSYRIPRRKLKYEKTAFSGDENKKAYLLGLCLGELHVHKHYNQIMVELTTTHPSMIQLFCDIFQTYGVFHQYSKYNKKTERYEWVIYILLDSSFNFLLSKHPDFNGKGFYYFLAGFFDAEGCLHVYKNHECTGLSLLIYNTNKDIIDYIFERLEKDKFRPILRKAFEKGKKTTNDYYRSHDLWSISLQSIEEVKLLLKNMPIKHREKCEKARIALNISHGKKWKDVSHEIAELRNQIKKETRMFVTQAADEWLKRHSESNV